MSFLPYLGDFPGRIEGTEETLRRDSTIVRGGLWGKSDCLGSTLRYVGGVVAIPHPLPTFGARLGFDAAWGLIEDLADQRRPLGDPRRVGYLHLPAAEERGITRVVEWSLVAAGLSSLGCVPMSSGSVRLQRSRLCTTLL